MGAVFKDASSLEQRLSDLQAQIDRLTIALQFWRDGHERASSPAQTDPRPQALLDEWATISERHARAVDALERQVAALRATGAVHAEHMVTSAAADDVTLFEQFAPLIGAAAHTGRPAAPPPPATDTPAADPGDRATDIDAGATANEGTFKAPPDPSPDASAPRVDWAPTFHSRLEDQGTGGVAGVVAMLRGFEVRLSQLSEQQGRFSRRLIVVPIGLLVLALAASGWWIVRLRGDLARVADQLQMLDQRSSSAAASSTQELAAARSEASRMVSGARDLAARAEATIAVLAAPDLVSYPMASAVKAPVTAHLLWSRSRGAVVSATGLPEPQDGNVHQAWLLAGGKAVSLGLLIPDAAGRATLVAGDLTNVAPVTGGLITSERQWGAEAPSGNVVARSGLAH